MRALSVLGGRVPKPPSQEIRAAIARRASGNSEAHHSHARAALITSLANSSFSACASLLRASSAWRKQRYGGAEWTGRVRGEDDEDEDEDEEDDDSFETLEDAIDEAISGAESSDEEGPSTANPSGGHGTGTSENTSEH